MEGIRDIRWNIRKFCKDDWPYPGLKESDKQYMKCTNKYTGVVTYDGHGTMTPHEEVIIEKSEVFPVPFPISTVRVKQLKERKPLEKLRRNITSTYPLIHERVLVLMAKFLAHKIKFGTDIEKQLYDGMSVSELIDRILKKRAACFVGAYDKYKLLTGEEGASGWEDIGTSEEKAPLTLENCLSYDEMKLSAMVYVSGYTECINDGARDNGGAVREDGVEDEAIIIGVIGPRFHRRGKMDYEDILITEEQNTSRYDFMNDIWDMFRSKDARTRMLRWREMWAEFYAIENNTFEDISQSDERKLYEERYIKLQSLKFMHPIFDNEVYYKRISVIAESMLLEANCRAEDRGKTAFLNVVGCGLGVWMISPHQADVYVLTFVDRIRALLDARALTHVSDVNFAYIDTSQDMQDLFSNKGDDHSPKKRWFFMECKEHPKGGINVQMQNREPSSKLTGEHEGKLLVMTYPWDSNAHPGNEFWFGSLTSSGDPAAACSTQVAELHNAHINPAVSGYNARVVGRHGLKTLADYCRALIA